MAALLAAIPRAVENRVPVLRSTASGVTTYIDETGRYEEIVPLYEQGFLVVDVNVGKPDSTLYNRWGDWFPIACAAGLLLLLALSFRKSPHSPVS